MGAWAATGIQAMTSTHEIHLSRLGSGEGKPVAIFLVFDPDMIEELRPSPPRSSSTCTAPWVPGRARRRAARSRGT